MPFLTLCSSRTQLRTCRHASTPSSSRGRCNGKSTIQNRELSGRAKVSGRFSSWGKTSTSTRLWPATGTGERSRRYTQDSISRRSASSWLPFSSTDSAPVKTLHMVSLKGQKAPTYLDLNAFHVYLFITVFVITNSWLIKILHSNCFCPRVQGLFQLIMLEWENIWLLWSKKLWQQSWLKETAYAARWWSLQTKRLKKLQLYTCRCLLLKCQQTMYPSFSLPPTITMLVSMDG